MRDPRTLDDAYKAGRWAEYEPHGTSGTPPADMKIRAAQVADCASIAAIEGSRDGGADALAQRRCETQVDDPTTLLLVAVTDDRVIGFARAGRLTRPVDATGDHVPDGWYLLGVVVVDAWRRRGIGEQLTRRRVEWIAERADAAYFFANARNRASLDLHAALGFVEISRRFSAPRVQFEGGEGVLCRLDLR
jgi:ribosomal protein S18 acetylase RimI-like enzyme